MCQCVSVCVSVCVCVCVCVFMWSNQQLSPISVCEKVILRSDFDDSTSRLKTDSCVGRNEIRIYNPFRFERNNCMQSVGLLLSVCLSVCLHGGGRLY
jgi:hypothetical protein